MYSVSGSTCRYGVYSHKPHVSRVSMPRGSQWVTDLVSWLATSEDDNAC